LTYSGSGLPTAKYLTDTSSALHQFNSLVRFFSTGGAGMKSCKKSYESTTLSIDTYKGGKSCKKSEKSAATLAGQGIQ
jgi:hypothetical protein